MRKILAIANALGDKSRLRTVLALTRGKLCVCQIAELLQLAPSTVSKHLSILKEADLVETEKSGRWVYYSLPQNPDSIVSRIARVGATSLEAGPSSPPGLEAAKLSSSCGKLLRNWPSGSCENPRRVLAPSYPLREVRQGLRSSLPDSLPS
jgi:DNA-binding transcriptional ArsR family regulator